MGYTIRGLAPFMVCVGLGSVFDPSCILAGDKPSESAFRFVIDGIRQERKRLKSAVCRIRGRIDARDPQDAQLGLEGPTELFIAFDSFGNKRLDRTEPGWIVDISGQDTPLDKNKPEALAKSVKGIIAAKSCRTTNKYSYWIKGTDSIQLARPQTQVQHAILRWLDLRAIGLAGQIETNQGLEIDEVIRRLERVVPVVDQSDPDVWILTWDFGGPISPQWRFWVRPRDGFAVTRAEARDKPVGHEKWRVTQEVETSWDLRNSVWVPIHHTMAVSSGVMRTYFHEYSLEWSEVNAGLDVKLFDYHSFGAPDGLGVIDSSLGSPIVVKSAMIREASKWSLDEKLRTAIALSVLLGVCGVIYAIVKYRRGVSR